MKRDPTDDDASFVVASRRQSREEEKRRSSRRQLATAHGAAGPSSEGARVPATRVPASLPVVGGAARRDTARGPRGRADAMGRKNKHQHATKKKPLDDAADDDPGADVLFYLRTKYALLGKSEWWWLMDDSLAEIDERLNDENFVVVDGFLPREDVIKLKREVKRAHETGHMTPGVLAGGKAGNATQYTMKHVRGDHVGWFSGTEADIGWELLPAAMKKTDTLVNELGKLGGECSHVSSRSQAMCSVYPGGGARYVRHVDNPDQNGRLVTALIYLNESWEEGDGGELRVFRCMKKPSDAIGFTDCDGRSLLQADAFDATGPGGDDGDLVVEGPSDVAEGVRHVATLRDRADAEAAPVKLVDVAPLGGRLVLFKSNARVPHEVLAANADRYAVTLWYFHKEEVTAARTTPVTEEEKRAQEEKIRREIETMRRKFGGGGGGDGGGDGDDGDAVKVRPSRTAAWTRALPSVPPPCAVRWDDDGTTLAFTVPLPRGTAAGECSVETEPVSGGGVALVVAAPGLTGGEARVELPNDADGDSIEVKLVKKPERTLLVRVACEGTETGAGEAATTTTTTTTTMDPPPPPDPPRAAPPPPPNSSTSAASRGKDCVGVGGTLSWTTSTDFTPVPPPPPPASKNVAPRGVDLRDAKDWEDYVHTRWSIAGRGDDQPVLTPHALDGLSFPVTLARALQLESVRGSIAAARRTSASAAAAPLTIVIAGASSKTEQFLLEHTRYWEEVPICAPQPGSGGGGEIHLVFVGPDAREDAAAAAPPRRLSPVLTASARRGTVGAFLSRELPDGHPAVVVGFNTGMGGGGGDLARAWAGDLVEILSREHLPMVLTAANDYADLRGEVAVFRALGANFAEPPAPNPFRAFTHTVAARGDGLETRADGAGMDERRMESCANAFSYVVRGFQPGKGRESGLSDDVLGALAAKAAERAAGEKWDALGMRR